MQVASIRFVAGPVRLGKTIFLRSPRLNGSLGCTSNSVIAEDSPSFISRCRASSELTFQIARADALAKTASLVSIKNIATGVSSKSNVDSTGSGTKEEKATSIMVQKLSTLSGKSAYTKPSETITFPEPTRRGLEQGTPLKRLLWRSYLHTSLIPLFVIEVSFLAIFWLSGGYVYDANIAAFGQLSRTYFNDIAHREATAISVKLEAIASQTKVFANQTRNALDGDYMPPRDERARYKILPQGGLITTSDNGTTASFYAGGTQIGRRELDKVWRLSALDPLMMSIKQNNSSISSIYFNTFDSYNRIFPYIDASKQYSSDMVIPSYNFYYEADEKHNPERREVWTEAYIDPAGHGWMVSSIAPVWRGDTLEGVVGIDVTLETIIDSLLGLDLPWSGYAILVDQSGGIIALPPAGEQDFGVDELTDHDYSRAILSDTFKPEDFNLNLRTDTRALAEAMSSMAEGEIELDLGGPRLASFSTVPQTGWRLVIIAPIEAIYADPGALNDRLETVALAMLTALLCFYLLFFAYLTHMARKMTRLIDEPIDEISNLIDHMHDRNIDPNFSGSSVYELNKLGHHMVSTRSQLMKAEEKVRTQSRIARTAFIQMREANSEMFNFTRLISHEIRTPLSIIDGSAQIIQRKSATLSPSDLRDRAARLRETVATAADLLTELLNRFDVIVKNCSIENGDPPISLCIVVRAIAEPIFSNGRLSISVPDNLYVEVISAGTLIIVMQNALEYVFETTSFDSPVDVSIHWDAPNLSITIASECASGSRKNLNRAIFFVEKIGGTLDLVYSPDTTFVKIAVPSDANGIKDFNWL